ncbi:A24 family peptidase [Streptomyces sp. NPDC005423]|uniref:prepilin peptidase n=1 Tax=Streptomyces sp. NPDC005423 TaxID=3155343 RepID=UPI0033AA6CF9
MEYADYGRLLTVVAVLWGAVAGALVPRAAHRLSVPAGEPWRGTCPAGHPLDGWAGRPGRSAWVGRARCGECAHGDRSAQAGRTASYGPGTGTVVTVTVLLCGVLAAATGPRPELAVWLPLTPVGVLLAAVDLRVRRLPDVLTLPFAGAALALLGVAALLPEHAGRWPAALYGALALGAGHALLLLLDPGGMGFGEVKLALGAGAVLGWYGWPTVLLGSCAGFVCGALYAGVLAVAGRAGREGALPFGPFLLAGAFLGVLAGAYSA